MKSTCSTGSGRTRIAAANSSSISNPTWDSCSLKPRLPFPSRRSLRPKGALRADRVVSIGCSQGEPPSVERLRVTVLNRYLGPDTIECTGVPGQGRSGGGLFTTAGSVVGICTNADPHDHRGVYAGLKPIHELLRSRGWRPSFQQRPARAARAWPKR